MFSGRPPQSLPEEDEDVTAERHKINTTPVPQLCKEYSLFLANLHKKYGSFTAVNHTCVGIQSQVTRTKERI
jgi:hypothetical protein